MQNFENQNTLIQWVNKLNIYIYPWVKNNILAQHGWKPIGEHNFGDHSLM